MLTALVAGNISCGAAGNAPEKIIPPDADAVVNKPTSVGNIPLPQGYTRVSQSAGSFGAWLRKMPLKADNTVYLYNGQQKGNQQAQYAVVDISVGNRDLQQCADAVMRLYAEYQYTSGNYSKIAFHATDGTLMDYTSWMKGYRFVLRQGKLSKQLAAKPCNGNECFTQYLQTVFSYAGTMSLSKELQPIKSTGQLQPGDVFIRGGSPGHAVIVMDVAQNNAGEKIFLLAQSYMPAQNIHVLKNPAAATPWYPASFQGQLVTPEWIFSQSELARFPG